MHGFEVTDTEGKALLKCKGNWTNKTLHTIIDDVKKIDTSKKLIFNLKEVCEFDTTAAIFLLQLQEQRDIQIIDAKEKIQNILTLCSAYELNVQKNKGYYNPFYNLGKKIFEGFFTLFSFISFLGGVFVWFFKSLLHPKLIRFKATLFHLEVNGVHALFIIMLTSFLIGVVIAYQGAVQLKQFGANIFIVEMTVISLTRELAPLIAAIVIAGRSASAYTAQIGVMKLTDEVDAMKTMGFDPWNFLILPRVLALVVALPLLVMIADSISIFGGMLIAKIELGISFVEFMDRFQEVIAIKHILIGLFKAPIFGFIIAVIGCFRGFQISSNTQSVGKYTTISVVNAIFWVIAFDAGFSILLTELGL